MGGIGSQPGAERRFIRAIAVLGMQAGKPSGRFRPYLG
jgi:hypothetical protein